MSGATPVSHEWDAGTYDRVSEPQLEWGREVLERLVLQGDETVLDAGCGSGRVTRLLLERLPRGRVIAVDASPSMVERARAALGPRAQVVLADLADLRLEEPVDAVFSSAVFHWIPDHDRLFGRLYDALKPGGRLVAQCGGRGNVANFLEAVRPVCEEAPFKEFIGGWSGNWHFASPDDASASLARAGFSDIDCRLHVREVQPPEPRDYLRSVCLGPHLELLPARLHESFLDAVMERLASAGSWTSSKLDVSARRPPTGLELDYVRLDIDARRP